MESGTHAANGREKEMMVMADGDERWFGGEIEKDGLLLGHPLDGNHEKGGQVHSPQ